MAIQLDLETSNYGVPFSGAYFRIASVVITRQTARQFSVIVDVVGYATKPTTDDIRDVDFRRYHALLDDIESQQGDLFLERVYTWVMKQDDMTGSIGV